MKFNSISDVVDATPKDTLNHIRNTFTGTNLNGEINWSVFGQFAGTQAYNRHSEGDKKEACEWSELGVEIYRRLKTKERPYENELAEMRLRANAIVFCGIERSVPLLDPAVIERWFLELIPFPLEEVRQRISKIENVSSEDFDDLRSLKERLSVIEGLIERSVFQKNAELDEWLTLREKLP